VRWYIPVASAFGKLRQEDQEFELKVSVGNIARHCLKEKKQKERERKKY
jgi:hypothetical protein